MSARYAAHAGGGACASAYGSSVAAVGYLRCRGYITGYAAHTGRAVYAACVKAARYHAAAADIPADTADIVAARYINKACAVLYG